MRLLRVEVLCVVVLLLTTARLGTAQESGGSGLMDFIHRLSGPAFVGPGASVFFQSDAIGARLRLSGTYRRSFRQEGRVTPDDASITMMSLQPMVEFPLQDRPFDLGVGIAVHRFAGDAEPFWHHSIPIQVQWRPRTARRWNPRIGVTLHAFPSFGEEDFEPLQVTVSRDDSEAVWQLFAGLDFGF